MFQYMDFYSAPGSRISHNDFPELSGFERIVLEVASSYPFVEEMGRKVLGQVSGYGFKGPAKLGDFSSVAWDYERFIVGDHKGALVPGSYDAKTSLFLIERSEGVVRLYGGLHLSDEKAQKARLFLEDFLNRS